MKKVLFSGRIRVCSLGALVVFVLAVVLSSSPVCAEEPGRDVMAFRKVMYKLTTGVEELFGLEPIASKAIRESSDEDIKAVLSYIDDKERFLHVAKTTLARIDAIKESAAAGGASRQPALTGVERHSSDDITFYDPAYPVDEGWYHNNIIGPLRFLGMTQNVEDRCHDFDTLPYTEELLFDLEQAREFADAACTAYSCPPIDLVTCYLTCTPVGLLTQILWVMKLPLEICAFHDGKIDQAELEATYEDGVTTLRYLGQSHDEVMAAIAALHGRLDGQDEMLREIQAGQEEIIKLLKTPQGKRPGWGVDGY